MLWVIHVPEALATFETDTAHWKQFMLRNFKP